MKMVGYSNKPPWLPEHNKEWKYWYHHEKTQCIASLHLHGNKLTTLPSDITNLKDYLKDLSIDYNALDISDPEIIQFLDANQRNWRQTQTVSPKQLTVSTITENSITLSWFSIAYTKDQGGYEIYCSRSNNDN